jgi:hypothetical protein
LDTGGGTSGLGESCTRTFDCKSGYACEENVCLPIAVATGDAGIGDGGEGGVGIPSGPHLGLLHESCQRSSDCQSPLECVGEQCTIVNYGLTATGKSCSGECLTATDCCEPPTNLDPGLGEWLGVGPDGGTVAHFAPTNGIVRCTDLLTYIGGDPGICGNVAAAVANAFYVTDLGTACFDYKTYCQCAPNTWTCTAANTCAYQAPCDTSSPLTACPGTSRTGLPLNPRCNVVAGTTAGTCTAGCATDSDCANKFISSSDQYCSAADAGGGASCTCYQSSCYFKCAKDLDCAQGSTCDPTTSLCKASSSCTTDSDCVQTTRSAQGKCQMGTCALSCTDDNQCGAPPNICSNGLCATAGCSSDADCPATGGPREFCVPTPTGAATYSSSITN